MDRSGACGDVARLYGSPPPTTACRAFTISLLAARLEAAPLAVRPEMVKSGLVAACGEPLDPRLRRRLGLRTPIATPHPYPMGHAALAARACPELATLDRKLGMTQPADAARLAFEVCEFDRYGVAGPDEMAGIPTPALPIWFHHEFLLGRKTPPQVARSITRALLELERAGMPADFAARLPGQRLPSVPAGSAVREGPVIHVALDRITLDGEPVIDLDAGRGSDEQIASLVYGALDLAGDAIPAPKLDYDSSVTIVADARVPLSTIHQVMVASGRADFPSWDFVVEPATGSGRAVHLQGPRYTYCGPPLPTFDVHITKAGFRVRAGDTAYLPEVPGEWITIPKLEADSELPSAWDHAGLSALGRDAADRATTPPHLSVGGDDDISVELLLVTFVTQLACPQIDSTSCPFAEPTLRAGWWPN